MPRQTRINSQKIYDKLCQVIPGGVNSPVRSCKGVEQLPMVVERGFQDLIYDADGHSYIDFCGSWGALIHGHAHPAILAAATAKMALGTSFGITTEIEEQIANKVVGLIDSVDKIRFVSSGTEATMSAVRLARGYTARDMIVKFDGNFHGHADFFLVRAGSGVLELNQTASSAGIPDTLVQETISLPYNNEEVCKAFLLDPMNRNKIAAVILEPVAANMGVVPATDSFIKMLRSVTEEIGALLIFDEVITGFRVALGGAQAMYGVKPDLTCFGKIIGGGFPAAAFGGRKDIMDCLAPLGSVYQAGTLSGNPVAMAAGLEALTLLQQDNFYENLERKTKILTGPIQDYLEAHPNLQVCLQERGSMFTLFFGMRKVLNVAEAQQSDAKLYGKFFRYLFDNGVYIAPLQWESWFVSNVHTEENLLKTRNLVLTFLENEM
ncbi:MAG: glutamate-1-semialdehyde 2,1-aminomutase [Parachlamydiaceae bacterium]|nr:glutamate-1-semialdehyde 2,1-aminomutase [Parachlamydiaceae bacterium]